MLGLIRHIVNMAAVVRAEKHVSDFWENKDKEWNWIHFWVDAHWPRIACFDSWVLCFYRGLEWSATTSQWRANMVTRATNFDHHVLAYLALRNC